MDYSLLLFPHLCRPCLHCCNVFLFYNEVSVGGPALFVSLSKLAIDVPAGNKKMHHSLCGSEEPARHHFTR